MANWSADLGDCAGLEVIHETTGRDPCQIWVGPDPLHIGFQNRHLVGRGQERNAAGIRAADELNRLVYVRFVGCGHSAIGVSYDHDSFHIKQVVAKH